MGGECLEITVYLMPQETGLALFPGMVAWLALRRHGLINVSFLTMNKEKLPSFLWLVKMHFIQAANVATGGLLRLMLGLQENFQSGRCTKGMFHTLATMRRNPSTHLVLTLNFGRL